MGNRTGLNNRNTNVAANEHRASVERLLWTEIESTFVDEIRHAEQQLVEAQRKAIRDAVEEYKLVVRQVMEEEKESIRASVEERRQAVLSLAMTFWVTGPEADLNTSQEPRTRAGVSALSPEAREVLAKVREGGIPSIITRNLERIANEHGIAVNDDMTPGDLVRQLHELDDSFLL